MTKMTNWSNFAGNSGSRVTTWNYDQYRGWLNNKRYPDNTGPDYTYTPGGKLSTRAWARTGTGSQRILTTYTYGFNQTSAGDGHGDLLSVAYSNDPQSTPSVTYTYDRSGRQKTIVQGSMTTTLTYNDGGELLSEAYTGGTLGGLCVTNGYDAVLRRTALALTNQPSTLVTYGYDTASRLSGVTNGTSTAVYAYLANSPLVSQITFRSNTFTSMTTTKSYDLLNRLSSISSAPSAQSAVGFSYTYNSANQRTRMQMADGAFWVYEYDSLGQVKTGKKYWPDWTPVAGQQFEYGFDDIGNRVTTKAGGDEGGANLRSATYWANNLNQYTARDVPGYVDVMGLELATNSVTVNSASTYRHSEYFRKEISVSNGSVPVWQSVTVAAPSETTVTGSVYVPKTTESFSYDTDGNTLSDGRFNYTWDAENRLIRLVANTSVGPQNRLDFGYDAKGRRIAKRVWNNTSGTGNPTNDLKFVYDSWNPQRQGRPFTLGNSQSNQPTDR
jgi:hypothetical protein